APPKGNDAWGNRNESTGQMNKKPSAIHLIHFHIAITRFPATRLIPQATSQTVKIKDEIPNERNTSRCAIAAPNLPPTLDTTALPSKINSRILWLFNNRSWSFVHEKQ